MQDAADQLSGDRAEALLRALVTVARAPRFTDEAARPARKVLAPRVLHADRRATHQIDGLRPSDEADSWHGARIAAKRARYAAEVGAPALGKACDALGQLWAAVTEAHRRARDGWRSSREEHARLRKAIKA